jgi:hypothetical protein
MSRLSVDDKLAVTQRLHRENGRRLLEIEQVDGSTLDALDLRPCAYQRFGRRPAGEKDGQIDVRARRRLAGRLRAVNPESVEATDAVELILDEL